MEQNKNNLITIDSKKRLKEILEILVSNNFNKGINPSKIKPIIEALGPIFVEICSKISTDNFNIPEELIKDFSTLNVNVEPLDFDFISNIIESNFNKTINELFSEFSNSPISVSNLYQIYNAKLLDNTNVFVKVKTPMVDEKIASDIALIQKSMTILGFSPESETYRQFNMILKQIYFIAQDELDFSVEISNLNKLYTVNKEVGFATSNNVINEYSNNNIIVTESLSGIPILNIDQLSERTYNLTNIANRLALNFIHQLIDYGTFNVISDPQNILIINNEIFFNDSKLGSFSEDELECIKSAISSYINKDADTFKISLIHLIKDIEKDDISVDEIFNNQNEFINLSIGEIIRSIENTLLNQNIKISENFEVLFKSLNLLDLIIKSLDPDVNLLNLLIESYEWNKEVSNDLISDDNKTVEDHVTNNDTDSFDGSILFGDGIILSNNAEGSLQEEQSNEINEEPNEVVDENLEDNKESETEPENTIEETPLENTEGQDDLQDDNIIPTDEYEPIDNTINSFEENETEPEDTTEETPLENTEGQDDLQGDDNTLPTDEYEPIDNTINSLEENETEPEDTIEETPLENTEGQDDLQDDNIIPTEEYEPIDNTINSFEEDNDIEDNSNVDSKIFDTLPSFNEISNNTYSVNDDNDNKNLDTNSNIETEGTEEENIENKTTNSSNDIILNSLSSIAPLFKKAFSKLILCLISNTLFIGACILFSNSRSSIPVLSIVLLLLSVTLISIVIKGLFKKD